ncbi:MAG: ArnT family glycosyltransferase [Bryobacteraceae bacterium]
MKDPAGTPNAARLLIFLLICAALAHGAVALLRPVIDTDEPLYLVAGRGMAESGDWVTPYVNGVRFFDKPALLYWLIGLSYKLFGGVEIPGRLPGILAILATAALLFRLGRLAGGPLTGFAAGAAFAFCAGTMIFTIEVLHDILLVFFVTLAMERFAHWYVSPERPRSSILGLYVAFAGAFLSKGFIGLLFPLAALGCYFALSRTAPPRALFSIPGLLLFAVLAAPWHIAAEAANPGFLRHYFINEQILRFLHQREPADFESVPLPAYFALLPVWIFPWSVFLLAWPFDRGRAAVSDRQRWIVRLALCWAGVVIGFFAISARLERYVFPAVPALALLAGIVVTAPAAPTRAFKALRYLGILFAILIPGPLWLLIAGQPASGDYAHSQTHLQDYAVLLEMPPAVLHQLAWPALGALLALATGFLAAARFAARDRRMAVGALVFAMAVLSALAGASVEICRELISSKTFGLALAGYAEPGEPVIVTGGFESANSILMYAPVRILVLDGGAPTLDNGIRYPDAPRVLLDRRDFGELWTSSRRVFLLVEEARRQEFPLGLAFELASAGGRVLLSNRP